MESAFEKLQRDLARDAEQQAEKKAAAAATVAEVQPGLLVRRLQNFPSPPSPHLPPFRFLHLCALPRQVTLAMDLNVPLHGPVCRPISRYKLSNTTIFYLYSCPFSLLSLPTRSKPLPEAPALSASVVAGIAAGNINFSTCK